MDSPTHCVVVKNAPMQTQLHELVQYLTSIGCDSIHHARVHANEHGLCMFFLYFYSPLSAILTVMRFNRTPYFGRNLTLTLHKDSKDEIIRDLWGNDTRKRGS